MKDPAEKLQAYLVGGAVRDRIMGIDVKDRDWVVVGSGPREMMDLGFRPVGKDFPVFLHPQTNEEYALARTEKKIARGYHGFRFFCGPEITLEQDLGRRDLTMNAIAMDKNGNIIDPYNGGNDIADKTLRHVSDAFREDPIRILRVARFAARFEDFNIDEDTRRLMTEMTLNGEVDALTPERVWQEMHRALTEKKFSRFVKALRDCGALKKILPEADRLFGVPQVEKYHPEIDTGLHILLCLDAAAELTDNALVTFAVLTHDLGKALTPKSEWPSHKGHEKRGLAPIASLCDRLGAPRRFREFALKVCRYHLHCHRIFELKPSTVLEVLEAFDGFRKPESICHFALCCDADKRGRTGHENDDRINTGLLLAMHKAALDIDQGEIARRIQDADKRGRTGHEIGPPHVTHMMAFNTGQTVRQTQTESSGGNEPGIKIKEEIRKQRVAAIAKARARFAA